MKSKEKSKAKIKPIKTVLYSLLGIIAVIVLAGLIDAGYAFAYKDKTLLNTYCLGKNITGYSPEKLKQFIDESDSNYPNKKIKIVYKDKNWEINYSDFNWQLDKDKTLKDIQSYGHTGGFFSEAKDTAVSLLIKRKFDLEYSFNENGLSDWITGINQEIGTPKEETNIIVKDNAAKITDSKAGESIDEESLRQQIFDHLALKGKGDITIVLVKDEPVITHQEAEALVDPAKQLSNHSVKLVGPNGSIDLDSNTLGSSIALKKKKVKKGFLKNELGAAYVSFDNEKIKTLLQNDSDKLNKLSVDAKFSISNGTINLTSPSTSGQVIKIDESVTTIVSALEQGKTEIQLPSESQQPSISAQSASDLSGLGIKEVIGTATTSFGSSPANRIHNIQTGVQYISGAIIKPGEEFSTIGRLGKIDQSGGYLPELVIKDNATVPEYGGGLCQVSTTLFRAAMNSGLKITERQNHSYRVSYYEPPVGMDATIYYPAPDFKFVNTTDNDILINGHVDGNKITFDFYGTKDDRTVNLTNPTVYDITQPPDSIYTDAPSLAPGEVKQIDHAHPGAKATFSYTVSKGGKVINQQTFNSYYVAWPAKFLRGPQTNSQSQPTQTATPMPAATQTIDAPPTP